MASGCRARGDTDRCKQPNPTPNQTLMPRSSASKNDPSRIRWASSNFSHTVDDFSDCALPLDALRDNETISQAEEEHKLWRNPKLRSRSPCLLLAQRLQSVRRIGLAFWMRSSPVADHDDLDLKSLPASLGDQAPAGQALIVRMGRHDDERPVFKALAQTAKGEAMRGGQKFASRHLHKSCAPCGCARTNAAVFASARSGPGWRR